ncbi:MAG: M20/M25/M40 family metallo-hydrolase [Clostridia bacterium]|nr:M20/M25/M40 family metallo-hydrolase [Clostridia bacterium]
MELDLLNKVDGWLKEHRQEIIDDLIGLVRIPSVSLPEKAVPPYGQACRDALAYMFGLAERHGYAFRNFDHYVGAVDFTKGVESVGIWAHLDVVPVPDPSEWDYPPFEGTLVEDRFLIGRGVQDNKMAAIGVFHVMNCLRDLGVPLRRAYSLYMGTSEETGMEDVQYFTSRYPAPDLSIVPDTGFPVCCAQRGCMGMSVAIPFAHEVKFHHSNNPSVTPSEITAVLHDGRTLKSKGDSAHIYKAENVSNAVLNMLKLLAEEYPSEGSSLAALSALVTSWHGESLGIAYADDISGALQMAATEMEWLDGKLTIRLYIILPVSAVAEDILFRARQRAAVGGAEVYIHRLRPSCSFPTDHPVVEVLTRTYNEIMHVESRPFVMSGGNYAAYLPNAFGYGPGMPGKVFPPHIFRPGRGDYHQCDECEDIEHLLNFMRVYALSIVELDAVDQIKRE